MVTVADNIIWREISRFGGRIGHVPTSFYLLLAAMVDLPGNYLY